MRTYSLDFSAGEIIEFSLTAAFFLLLEDGGTNVNIEVATTGGNYSKISDVGAGFGFRAPHDSNLSAYTNLRFYSPVAQTIKFYAGNSEAVYNRLGGVVNVSGTISTKEAGTPFTNTFKSVTNIAAANGVENVFTAAANVNGVVISALDFYSQHSTNHQQGGFYARLTAPTVVGDSGCILGLNNIQINSGVFANSIGSLRNSILVPAGLGVWFLSSFIESNCHRSCVYTILP